MLRFDRRVFGAIDLQRTEEWFAVVVVVHREMEREAGFVDGANQAGEVGVVFREAAEVGTVAIDHHGSWFLFQRDEFADDLFEVVGHVDAARGDVKGIGDVGVREECEEVGIGGGFVGERVATE